MALEDARNRAVSRSDDLWSSKEGVDMNCDTWSLTKDKLTGQALMGTRTEAMKSVGCPR